MSNAETELKRTPIYEEHVALGARMVSFTGYSMPVQYTGIVDEHNATRNAVGMFDVSHMGELLVEGDVALALVDSLVTNDVGTLIDGQARYTVCCNERGTALDDLIIYRVSATKVMVVCNASNRAKIVGHFKASIGDRAKVTDISDETALIAVQGPKAIEFLAHCDLREALADLHSFHFKEGSLFGIPLTVSRTGYTGEDGAELFCPPSEAARLWRELLARGTEFGVKPAGLGARNTLRLEARMALYGNDIDETTNPLEAGLGWTVKFEKGEFVGRAALVDVKTKGSPRKLVGFEMTEKVIARDHWDVVDDDSARIGYVTSGSPGPTVGKNIGLAYVPTERGAIGAPLKVRDPARGRMGNAVVVKTPFYKRAK